MSADTVIIRGARQHNLKGLDLDIPRDRLVVITGLSGSGKSSLAFDTIYAEGQRRYVESLSAYARQFLEQMEKPDVDYMEGLSPAISIEQRTASRNPRSTLGTVTEISDYLRVLFARIGEPHCPRCGPRIQAFSVGQMVDVVLGEFAERRVSVLSPLVRGRKGEHRQLLEKARAAGYVRARVDGRLVELEEPPALDKNVRHDVEVVIDRLRVTDSARSRLAEALDAAARLSGGLVTVADGREMVLSESAACPTCGFGFGEISPRLFSFNSPYGACQRCGGLGRITEPDPGLVVPDEGRTLRDGAVIPWARQDRGLEGFRGQKLASLTRRFGVPVDVPFRELSEEHRRLLLYGTDELVSYRVTSSDGGGIWKWRGRFEGALPELKRRYLETTSSRVREELQRYMAVQLCPECGGARLKPESLAVKVGGASIADVSALSVGAAASFFRDLHLGARQAEIARQILKEVTDRLEFLRAVGLDYLTLDRSAATLAGGEAQRIRLATQIGSSLVGVLYVLDEPSIGLHYRDNNRLLDTLRRLRDVGNTVIVVEHDRQTILAADHVIDLGPGAGEAGGRLVAQGTPAEVMSHPESLTGLYLRGERRIPVPSGRRRADQGHIAVIGASHNNLKHLSVTIPLGLFVCVTGVSGSGKSSLVTDTLYAYTARRLYGSRDPVGDCEEIRGLEQLDKVVNIDQSPIGRTPRSNPATYTGAFGPVRKLFSQLPLARMRGYGPGRFSFNVKGGRCEACQGAGVVKIEMHFMPDVFVRCDVCGGRRFNRETLEVAFKGHDIADVLDLSVEDALGLFHSFPAIRRKLATLSQVGLGYVRLGQPATTLSGGEAQRVKLSSELSKVATGRTLYILDEPTTGLHFEDVRMLLDVLGKLVDNGNTVLVIEHNMDVIKAADHVIDLGPEGGAAGGEIVVAGTPEEVAAHPISYTGRYLRDALRQAQGSTPANGPGSSGGNGNDG
jgi:excinuclease ABC subunit A